MPYQQQISELIKKGFYLHRDSEQLLKNAKEMVEEEIEKNETNKL